ncbi:MAG: phosphoglucosamine mutase [Pseudomonadota bacterium]|nr:phosphoglucosamine mutase [Pseudomonadota bacterium]
MRKYFGTDGIRGVVGEYPITPDFALRLGYAAGKVLGSMEAEPAVIIGKDTRLSGYLFESSLEAGFSYAGVNVYMAGPIPTPAIAYLASALHLSAGVVISASHNPYIDNGIKFFSGNGVKLPDEVELAIEKELECDMKKAERLGKVVRLDDASGRYIEFCKSTFPRNINLGNLKIVLDCANGAVYKVAPSVFKELGAKVIKLACEPNGTNINANCGSMHPEELIKTVIKEKADLGIAFDGDGDRVLFVDENGVLYNGDKLIYIIACGMKAQHKKVSGIVGTVMTNMAMEVAMHNLGVEFIRSKVGDRYVLEELVRRKWSLGGEASGHILCLDQHSTGDGIVSALQVIAAMITLAKPLSCIVDWQEYPQTMINVKLDKDKSNWNELARDTIIRATDSLGSNGRVVVRPSGTEPLVRVMVEARDECAAKKWALAIANTITN